MELYNVARSRGLSYKETWKIRQTWIGFLRVFAVAIYKALIFGPHKKPAYKVTRKETQFGLYWKEVSTQILLVGILVFSMARKLTHFETLYVTDIILLFWSCFLIYGLSRVIRNSMHGITFKLNLRHQVVPAF